jgi:peroxiredoxin
MALKVGDPAPLFTLLDSDKNEVSLENFKGENVLLLFYPFAFTGTCTAELCAMRDNLTTYQNLNASVLALSIDTVFVQAKFKEENALNFPVLSDFNKEVSGEYDVLYEEFVLGMRGVAKRSAFVIDKEGIIQYAEVLEKASDLPDFEKIKEKLKSLN